DEHYKKVDGTSFAAPIVTSIVAQMLEANPALSPGEVKRILMLTAQRVPGIELERQGWGEVKPEAAVKAALQARCAPDATRRGSPRPDPRGSPGARATSSRRRRR